MTKDLTDKNIVSNEKINPVKLERAKKIILELQNELKSLIAEGAGPFLAAVYDAEGKLIAKTANSVVSEGCSNNHAEMNAIKAAEKALNTFDLSSANLSLRYRRTQHDVFGRYHVVRHKSRLFRSTVQKG